MHELLNFFSAFFCKTYFGTLHWKLKTFLINPLLCLFLILPTMFLETLLMTKKNQEKKILPFQNLPPASSGLHNLSWSLLSVLVGIISILQNDTFSLLVMASSPLFLSSPQLFAECLLCTRLSMCIISFNPHHNYLRQELLCLSLRKFKL